jgi:hypothetical protein
MNDSIVTALFALFLLSPNHVKAREYEEEDVLFSSQTISAFIQSAECLSLKASAAEKRSFITALEFQSNPGHKDARFGSDWFDFYEKDAMAIELALQKHCPYSYQLVQELFSDLDRDAHGLLYVQWEDIVVSIISVELLDVSKRQRIFEGNYTPIGMDVSPY